MPYVKCVTPEQEKALEELKSLVENELTSPALLNDDALFYKFLKDKGFNVNKAEKVLRKVFVKCVEPNVIGFDKDGDIVTFVACVNNPELVKCIKLNDYMKHFIWFSEKMISLNKMQAKKAGLNAPMTLIMDLDKLDFSNATSRVTTDIFLRIARLIRDNYAERLKAAYVINGGWKEKLLEAIDADVLPAFLGGKRTDPDGDPFCRSFIRLPENIPESYYLSDEERFFKNPAEICRLMISPSQKKEISIIVNEVGSLIRWEFMAVNKTIAFGLFFQESGKLKEIIPMYEYDTSDGTERNFYKCTSKGNYVIIFDNSYSRFSSKEIQYTIRVEKPET